MRTKSKTRVSASGKTKKKNPATKQLTYFVKSKYYHETYINNIFKSRQGNWREIRDTELQSVMNSNQRIDYIYLDGSAYYDKEYFGLLSNVKNMINDKKQIVTLKHNLIRELSKTPDTKKYIMPQIELDMLDVSLKAKSSTILLASIKSKLSSGKKPYIFKPVTGFAGSGIITVTTYSALYKYILQIISKYRKGWGITKMPGTERNRMWVLQEYIENPLLSIQQDGKAYKFHIRHYFIYVPNGISYFTKHGEIAIARSPYIDGEWNNKRVHDTHFYGRDGDKWPDALNINPAILTDIDSQFVELYKFIHDILKKEHVGCYTESLSCFELFGVDLMITDKYQVKIIELNSKTGLASNLTEISRNLFEGCLDLIVIPGLLKSKPPNPADYGFIPLA